MRRDYPFFRFLLWIALFIAILTVGCIVFYFRSRPVIYKVVISNAESKLLIITNQVVKGILEEDNIQYENIVNLSSNSDGEIMSLDIDQYTINYLKTEIASRVSDMVSKSEDCMVEIPFGSLLGNEYTVGLGPNFKLPMRITSTAFVDFKSEFKSTGINNVLHKISVVVNVRGSIVMSGAKYGFSVSTDFIAAQTVIVGRVPDAFTNVIENPGDDMAGYIFDYGYTE